jgi:hypothetical protein
LVELAELAPGPVWHFRAPLRHAAELRRAAARILSETQFRSSESLLQRALGWLSARLSSLHLLGFLGGTWQGYVVLGALVLLAGAVVYFGLKRRLPARSRPTRASPGVVSETVELLSPARWREEAERLAREGRFKEALRCRYRALVGELAARGLVEEIPGRTSGEYERLVRAASPEIGQHFSAATDLFERCWYGQEPIGDQEQQSMGRSCEEVVTRAGPGRQGSLAGAR